MWLDSGIRCAVTKRCENRGVSGFLCRGERCWVALEDSLRPPIWVRKGTEEVGVKGRERLGQRISATAALSYVINGVHRVCLLLCTRFRAFSALDWPSCA
jgi:hypothetical protein